MERVLPCQVCTELSSFRCAYCGVVTYCGRRCQRQDWHTHRYSCTRLFTARAVNGEEYAIDCAAVHTVSDIRAQLDMLTRERYGSRSPMVEILLIREATFGAWYDATKMKDLFTVIDTAEIMFTLQSPMPSLVSSRTNSSDARDASSDARIDDSSNDSSAGI